MKDFFDELINALADVCGVTEEKLKKQDRIAELMVEKEKKFPELPDAVIKFLEEYGNDKEEPKEKNVEYPKYVVDSIDLKAMEDGCYGICEFEEYDLISHKTNKKTNIFRKLGTKVEYFNKNCEPCGFDYVDTCCDEDSDYFTAKATYDYTVTDFKDLLNHPLGYAITAMTKDFYDEVR